GGRDLVRRYSPIHHVAKDMPPLLLIHGTSEELWKQGVAMRDRLRDAGAPHELLALEGAPHGMENWEGHPEWAHYKKMLVEWLGERRRSAGRGGRRAQRPLAEVEPIGADRRAGLRIRFGATSPCRSPRWKPCSPALPPPR